jgi:hypothetical protein
MPVSTRRNAQVLVAVAIGAGLLASCRGGLRAAAGHSPDGRPRRASVSLLFLGDINMGRTLGRRLRAGETDYPFARIRDVVSEADFACASLEVQVSDLPGTVGEPNSLTYCAPAVAARVMKDAGFDAVWSANNHMWDYGKAPLLDTIANLDAVGLPHTGIGEDLDEAYRPVVAEVGGWRVATLSVTSIFNSEFTGAPARMIAWADLDRTRAAIERVRPSVDYVVVNHHGGVEYSEGPTHAITEFDRACIDAGADAVVGSHPHVFQGGEWWHGKPILYSVGNLVFVQHPAWTDVGLGLRVRLSEGARPELEILGLRAYYQPRVVDDTRRCRERFRALSRRFAEPLTWGEDGRVAPPAQG